VNDSLKDIIIELDCEIMVTQRVKSTRLY